MSEIVRERERERERANVRDREIQSIVKEIEGGREKVLKEIDAVLLRDGKREREIVLLRERERKKYY